MEGFLSDWGVKHVVSSAYHPASNGQIERFNGTLMRSVAILINNDAEKWENVLELAVYAYNHAVNETTGFPPAYLAYGSCDDSAPFRSMGCESCQINGSWEQNLVLAHDRLTKLQEKNMANANRKRHDPHFVVGEQVLVVSKPLKQQPSAKLCVHCEGSYVIKEVLGPNSFQLKKVGGRQERTMNAENIKRYYPRSSSTLWCESTGIAVPSATTVLTSDEETDSATEEEL